MIQFRRLTLLLAITGVLAACKGETQPSMGAAPADASATTPAAVAADPAATCPDTDFDAFLARFEASADAQRTATADPLTMTRIDPDAQPEPSPITEQVPLAQVDFPVMADPATRQAEGAQVRIESRGENARDVVVGLPDTGAQVHFEFEAAPCWTLVKVRDESL